MAPCESLWGDLSLESQPVVCGGHLISHRMDSERWSGEGGPGANVTELGLTRWVHGGAWLTEQIRRATALVGAPSPSVCSSALRKWRRAGGAFLLTSGDGAFCFLAGQTRHQAAQVPVANRIKKVCLQGC